MSAASKTVTAAATWPAGASVRVADTTIASETGATASVSRTGASVRQSADAVSNPLSDAWIRQPAGGDATRKLPSASLKIDAAAVPSLERIWTTARGTGRPAASTTTPASGAGCAARLAEKKRTRTRAIAVTRASLRRAHAPLVG